MRKLTDKQRYINLMQKVNKVMINESVFDTNTGENLLYSSFEQFLANNLTIMSTNTNVSANESFVELDCVDDEGNKITFNFKVIADESEQDGVFKIGQAELINFSFSSSEGKNNVDIDETGLRAFNQKYGSKLVNIVSEYIDVEENQPDEEESLYEVDTLYESAINKIDSIGNMSHFNSLSPETMEYYYNKAKILVDNYMRAKGLTPPNKDSENYIGAIWKIANDLSIEDQAVLNERRKAWVDGSQAVEVKRECQLGGLGDGTSKACNQGDINNLTFSPLSEKKDDSYPNPIAQDFSGGGDYPKTKKKYRITKKKIKEEDNFGVPGYSQIRMSQDNIQEFDDDTADILLGFEPKNVGDDINQISKEKTEMGDMIHGGLADEKKPSDFSKEQLAKGIKVEMEHTDDPLIAIEIAMDHLTEDPEYYGIGEEDPENMAQQNASMEAGEFDDYKPINVGESFNDEKYVVVFDGTTAYVQDPHEPTDEDCEIIGTYYDINAAQRVADRYNDKAQGTQMTEEENFEVNNGDRFEDANGNQYTVNNKTNDKVNVRSNDGKQQEITPDALRFTKKM